MKKLQGSLLNDHFVHFKKKKTGIKLIYDLQTLIDHAAQFFKVSS